METFNVSKADKVTGFQAFLYGIRDKSGGLIMSLIIPPTYKDLMLNPKIEELLDESSEFYLYGWYNQNGFPIYIDKTLTDSIYLIGNYKSNKIKVTSNGA
jgi:hypothetical protein